MIRAYRSTLPRIHPTAFVDDTAQVIGDVEKSGNVKTDADKKFMASAKDRSEHAYAVDSAVDSLRPHCADLVATEEPYGLIGG